MILELHKKNEMVFNDAKTAIQGSCILCRLIVLFILFITSTIRSRIKIGGTGRGKKENKGICGLDWDGIL
ncbi:hypothetical protein T4B_289 [Trichinella pseudospiralis]|uniref:Transmembrane protein n=1 Tax=Trichinella pseudospiralis TaxID=6337 RepID=A0A0V1K4W5_TRIPS|nr:hypothetical protein T4B_289 [Trichinella pseudospiralis]KRZ28635.1 hypothetical protein T4C_10613 [Trichinella pseudospiralis]KRZ41845.1 hypothetical protein T4C_5101 [Trichinella pseudospiralis]KRZ41848.1 hypothetical protein T4C_13093 [Trichinella pseudospiralis]